MHDAGEFGRRLRQLRRRRDFTQEELAQAAFCALDTVKKLEGGRRRPSRHMAAQLADVFGLAGDERATFLAAARQGPEPDTSLVVPDQDEEPATSAVTTTTRRHLPRALTPFIGRACELSDLVARLCNPDVQLVTLVAPGGMGKTRLALAAAEQLQHSEAFPNGVAFAALAQVSDMASLEPTLADALGLPLDAGGRRPPRVQLLDYLREKQLLLILDNCEHLREAVAELALAILAQAPGVTLLATSRERLALRAEHMQPLHGMPTEADGVLLFAATARAVHPAFELDEKTRLQVATICTQVGGMPLAIELAASWADTLSLAEIAAELEHGVELLATEVRDIPERQRSVRVVCDATWGRLSPAEQAVFAQVAVFRGGGTRQALQAATGASLPQLQALVGKALLRYDPQHERYAVHELLRQYAEERLGTDAEAARETHERHAAYYLEALAAHEVDLKGAGQRAALELIAWDIENVHTAWTWATGHDGLDLLTQAAGCLSLADEWLGRSADGLAAFSRAAAVAVPPELRAQLLAAQARFTFLRGDRSGALELLAQAQSALDLNDSDRTSTERTRAQVLLQLGHCLATQNYAAAHDAYTSSQALFEASGDAWGAAIALAGAGFLMLNLSSSYEEARRFLEQSVARYRALGDQIGLSEVLTNLSVATRYLGELSNSLALAGEAYELAKATGNPRLTGLAASNLGAALGWTGAYDEAYLILRSALALTQELGHQADLPNIYYRLGVALSGLGDYAEARAAFSSGLELAHQLGDLLERSYLLSGLSGVALAEGVYTEALRLAEENLEHSERLGESFTRRLAFRTATLAARRLGDTPRARSLGVAGLRFALATQGTATMLGAVALLLADSGAPQYAAGLAKHAGWMQEARSVWIADSEMDEIRAILAALPPEVLARAQARWAQHSYWALLEELLAEIEARGWGAEETAGGRT